MADRPSATEMGYMARHMLLEGSTAEDIVYAMERPDKHLDVMARVEASLSAEDASVEELHLLDDQGRCRISYNGQIHAPCTTHSEPGAWAQDA